MNPRDVTRNRTVKYCGDGNIEWNYNTKEGYSFLLV
jgi:hypothetical protein